MTVPLISNLMNLSPIQRQSTIQLGFTLLVTLFGFFSTMLFSHLLGSSLMGVYFLFITYYSIFNLIGDGGFGSAAIKRISEGHDQEEYMTAYAVLRTILIIVSTIVLLAIQPLFTDLAAYNLVPWIIAALCCAYFSGLINAWVSGQGHMGIRNMAVGFGELARIGVSVVLVLLGFSVYGMIGGYLVSILLGGLLAVKYFRFHPKMFHSRHLKHLLTFSFWVLLMSGSSMLITYSDTIFVGYFMENSNVGVFRIALQFTTFATIIATAINSTLAPKISNWYANDHKDWIPHVVARSITMSLIIAVPMAIGGFLLADKLLYYFYGADFASGYVICCILLVFQIFSIFLTFFSNALSNTGFVRKTFTGTLVAVLMNCALDIILIPRMGMEGAAIASLISLIVNMTVVYYHLHKLIPIKIEWKCILHMLIASLLMAVFVFIYCLFVPLDNVVVTLIPVAIGACIYFFILFKVDRGIRNEIAEMVEKFGAKWPKWL